MPFHKKKQNGPPTHKKLDMKERGDAKSKLKEHDVGITEYISKHEGFNGVIKQRFSDFHVNEIDSDGNIVCLTNMTPPVVQDQGMVSKIDHEETLKNVVSEDVLKRIKDLVEQNQSSASVEIEVTNKSKEERRVLHEAIKGVGVGKLISNTKENNGKKFIVVIGRRSKSAGARDKRVAWSSSLGGDYVHFVLHKENIDTLECVNLIASKLRVKPNMVTYAGTKDRRAKTSQMMSVWRIEPKKLAQVSNMLRCVNLGNYTFKPKGLKLGDLQGNRFRIVLRNVTGSDEQIKEAMTSLCEKGFLNYYGLQRFGSSSTVPTYEIGKALLQGNWKLAVELILKPRECENKDMAEARKIWWETRNASQALKVLRNKEKLVEGKLLLGLSLCKPNDYFTALEKIPRNMRLLYLHSYQSIIWNKVVSRRIKEFGLQLIPGDLTYANVTQKGFFNEDEEIINENEVINENEEIINENEEVINENEEVINENEEVINENEEAIDDNEEGRDKLKERESVNDRSTSVKIIPEEDLKSFSIHDVVMPLPGHDVSYPENIIRSWYEDLLKEDGLSSATLKQNVRKYSVGGAYRKMMIRPKKLSWKIVRYSDPDETLELSDIEILKSVPPPKEDPGGPYKALILDFCLPSSTYATMALREILKADTSAGHQASLNAYYSSAHSVQIVTSSETSVPVMNEPTQEQDPSESDKSFVQKLPNKSEAQHFLSPGVLNTSRECEKEIDKGLLKGETNDIAAKEGAVSGVKRKEESNEDMCAKKLKIVSVDVT